MKGPLLQLCTRYYLTPRGDGRPIDPVARFHLKNGARLEHLNWLADTSPSGLTRAAGLMVNYRYERDEIEKNHEAYMRDGKLALGADFRALVKALRAPKTVKA